MNLSRYHLIILIISALFIVVGIVTFLVSRDLRSDRLKESMNVNESQEVSSFPVTYTLPGGWKEEKAYYEMNPLVGGGPIHAAILSSPYPDNNFDDVSDPRIFISWFSYNPEAALEDVMPLLASTATIPATQEIIAGKRALHSVLESSSEGKVDGEPTAFRTDEYLLRLSDGSLLRIQKVFQTKERYEIYASEVKGIIDSLTLEDSIKETVKNNALGIEVSFDPEVLDATSNYDEKTNDLYSPFVGFSSADVSINIQSYDYLEAFFELANTYSATPLDGFMSLTRYDHSGYSGYKMWYWGVQTPEPRSRIIYRFHRGADILEVDGSIVATDPTSQAFKNSEKILDDLVENIIFINASGKDVTEVTQTIPSIIDLAIFSEHSPTSARIADKIPSEKEKLTSTVNNEDLGVSVNYDSEAFKVLSNVSDETWGGPSLMLESKDIRLMFGIGLKEHFDKIEVFPSTVPLSSIMAITRYDHSGYAGKRTWRWSIHNQQPTRTSSIGYMFYRGSDVLDISAHINEQDPRSDHFRELVDQVDSMIRNMVFIGKENQEYRNIQRDIVSKIDSDVFNNKE